MKTEVRKVCHKLDVWGSGCTHLIDQLQRSQAAFRTIKFRVPLRVKLKVKRSELLCETWLLCGVFKQLENIS